MASRKGHHGEGAPQARRRPQGSVNHRSAIMRKTRTLVKGWAAEDVVTADLLITHPFLPTGARYLEAARQSRCSRYWRIAPKIIRVVEARPREDQPEYSGTERNLPGDIDGGRRRAEIRVAAHQRLQAEQEIRHLRPGCNRKVVPGRPTLARGPRHDEHRRRELTAESQDHGDGRRQTVGTGDTLSGEVRACQHQGGHRDE